MRRKVPRASLEGIPAELRLEIFKHLLPENLPVYIRAIDDDTGPGEPKQTLLKGCADLQSLMFICRQIYEETTVLLFQNINVTFDILINQCTKDLRLPGLYGFEFAWFSNPAGETVPRRVSDVKAAVLADYLRKVRYVTLVVREQYALKDRVLGARSNICYRCVLGFFFRALDRSRGHENRTTAKKVSICFVWDNSYFVRDSWAICEEVQYWLQPLKDISPDVTLEIKFRGSTDKAWVGPLFEPYIQDIEDSKTRPRVNPDLWYCFPDYAEDHSCDG